MECEHTWSYKQASIGEWRFYCTNCQTPLDINQMKRMVDEYGMMQRDWRGMLAQVADLQQKATDGELARTQLAGADARATTLMAQLADARAALAAATKPIHVTQAATVTAQEPPATTVVVPSEETQTAVAVPPVPRKRGRPRKVRPEVQSEPTPVS